MYYDFRESMAILYVAFLIMFWVVAFGLAHLHAYLYKRRMFAQELEEAGIEIVRKGLGQYWILRYTEYGEIVESTTTSKRNCVKRAKYLMENRG